ncbi:MAG: raqprd family integrative conjugative element protein [Proteobacteria bacterium]|jgi:RAQPRD family integrative conjugative element protein|nr:raqprd family integrative conjugative element protein [Pseudomonadota bacterium]
MQGSAKFAGVLLLALISAPIWIASSAQADEAPERERLTLITRQLAHIDRQINEVERIALSTPAGRFHFDYSQLRTDLRRVQAGIHAYLNPSRTQPRDAGELPADYIREDENE